MPARRKRMIAAVAATALLSAGLAATVGGGAASASTNLHLMTPATAAGYRHLVGKVADASHSDGQVFFSCQTSTPADCYGPDQIRAAYGVDQLPQDGAGTTIAIVDAYSSPSIQDDLASFDNLWSIAAPPSFTIATPYGSTPFDPNDSVQVNWSGEISLDVEWAHAIAPAANIELVLAKTSNDLDIEKATRWVINQNSADVLSQSYGEAEQCMDPAGMHRTQLLFRKAKAQGMTVFASAGDQGATQPTCDGTSYFKAVSTPATDPNVTAVGGTLLDANGTSGAYNSETTWNEPDYASAGGGGYSADYAVPNYQKRATGATNTARAVPDISYNAGINTGVLTVWSESGQGADLVFRFGGTSAGSPQWAGLTALADEAIGGRAGALNPTLYTLSYNRTSYAADFHDITTGNNSDEGITGYSAGAKWDAATGLGTPKADSLIPAIEAAHATS